MMTEEEAESAIADAVVEGMGHARIARFGTDDYRIVIPEVESKDLWFVLDKYDGHYSHIVRCIAGASRVMRMAFTEDESDDKRGRAILLPRDRQPV